MTTLQQKHHSQQQQQQHQQQDPLLLMLHHRRSLHHTPASVASSSSSSSAFASPARSGQQLNNNNINKKKLRRSFLTVPASPSSSSSPRAISPCSPRSHELPQNPQQSKNTQLNQRLTVDRNPDQLPSAKVNRAQLENSIHYPFRQLTKQREQANANPSQLRNLPERSHSLQNQLRKVSEDPIPDPNPSSNLTRLRRHPEGANSKSNNFLLQHITNSRSANNDQSCGNTYNPNPSATHQLQQQHQQQHQQQLNKKSVLTRSKCLQEHEDMDSSRRPVNVQDTGPNSKRMKLQDLNFQETSVSPGVQLQQQISSRRLSENIAQGSRGPHRRSPDVITQYGNSPTAPAAISDESHKPSKKRKLRSVVEPEGMDITIHRDRDSRHGRVFPTTTGSLSSPSQTVLQSKPFKDSAAASTPKECQRERGPEKNLLSGILDKLQKKDKFGVFAEPVDADEVPGYYDIIKDPMDFGTMRKRIESGHYTSLHPFQKDIFTICNNAMTFNGKGTVYYRHARSIKDVAEKILEELGMPRSTLQIDDIPRKSENESTPKPADENPPRPANKVNNVIPKSMNEILHQQPEEIPHQQPDEIPPESTDVILSKSLKSDQSRHMEEVSPKSSTSEGLSNVDKELSGDSEDEDPGPRASMPLEEEDLGEDATFSGPAESSARNSERHSSSSPSENRVDNQEDLSGYCSRGKSPKSLDENLRNTYVSVNDESEEVDPLVTILSDERLEIIPVGCQIDFPYAKSLARFAADLGPLVWKHAAEKIQLVLPPGEPFGPGWVGEKEYPTASSPPSKQAGERETPVLVDTWKSQLQPTLVDKGSNENQPIVSSKSPPGQSQHTLICQQNTNNLDKKANLHSNGNKSSVVNCSDSIQIQKIFGIQSHMQSRASSPVNLNQPAIDNAIMMSNSESPVESNGKQISIKSSSSGHVLNMASGLSNACQGGAYSIANQLQNSVSKPNGNVDNNATRGNLNMSVASPSMHLPFDSLAQARKGNSAHACHAGINVFQTANVNKSFSDSAGKANHNMSILKDIAVNQHGNKSSITVTSLNADPNGQKGSKDTVNSMKMDISSQNGKMNSKTRPMFLHNLNIPASQVSPRQSNGHFSFDKSSVPNNLNLSANSQTSTRESVVTEAAHKQASSSTSDSIILGNVNSPQGSQYGHNLNLPSQNMLGIPGYNGARMANRVEPPMPNQLPPSAERVYDTSQSSVGLHHSYAKISQRVQHGDANIVPEPQRFHSNTVFPTQQNNKAAERDFTVSELLQSKYASMPQSERMHYEGQNSLLSYNNLNSPAPHNSQTAGQEPRSEYRIHPKHAVSQNPEVVNPDIGTLNRATHLHHTLSRFSNEAVNLDYNGTELKQVVVPQSQYDTVNSSRRVISHQNLNLQNHSLISVSQSGRNEAESVHSGSNQSSVSNNIQDGIVKPTQFTFSYSQSAKSNRPATPTHNLNSPSGSQMDNSSGLLQSRQFQNNAERSSKEMKGVDVGFNAGTGNMNGIYKGPNGNEPAPNDVKIDQSSQTPKCSILFANVEAEAGARDNQRMPPGWLPVQQPDLMKLQNTVSQTPVEGQHYDSIHNTQRHFSRASVEYAQCESLQKPQNQKVSSSVQAQSSHIRQNTIQDQKFPGSVQLQTPGNQKNLQSVPHFLQQHLIQNQQMQMRIQSSSIPSPVWYVGNSEPRDLNMMNQMMQMAGQPIAGLQHSGNMPWQYMSPRMTQQGSRLPFSGAPDLNVSLPSNRSPYEQSTSNEVQQPDLALQL